MTTTVIETESQLPLVTIERNETPKPSVKLWKKSYKMTYFWFMWGQILFFTFITVLDRYTFNLWPLWVDSAGPTIPGNWSATVFTIVSWVSSRMMLVSCAYIFLLQNNVFWNWFSEHSPNWLYVGDILKTNHDIHYYLGVYFIGIPVVLHVWTIIIPAGVFNNMKLYTSWMRPKNGVTNIDFWDGDNNLFNLAMNDVYRIFSTSLAFFILFPISMSKKCRKICFNKTMWIHLIAATIFTVDLIRMKSHPHCWFFNVPFIFWWMLDRAYGVYCYRRMDAKIVKKINIDNQYIILFVDVPDKIAKLKNIGDVFHLSYKNCEKKFEKSHVFTTFQNYNIDNNKNIFETEHIKNKFDVNLQSNNNEDSQDNYYVNRKHTSSIFDDETDASGNNEWKIGFVMRVFDDHDKCFDKRKTWTKHMLNRLINDNNDILTCYGPYRSEYRHLLSFNKNIQYPLILIATGAGCSYIIDFYNYILKNNIKLHYKVYFYFSTNSIKLYQWFTNITCKIPINNLFINAHLTKKINIHYDNSKSINNYIEKRELYIGRMSFDDILNNADPNTHVYICGSPSLQNTVKKICKRKNLLFFYGTTF